MRPSDLQGRRRRRDATEPTLAQQSHRSRPDDVFLLLEPNHAPGASSAAEPCGEPVRAYSPDACLLAGWPGAAINRLRHSPRNDAKIALGLALGLLRFWRRRFARKVSGAMMITIRAGGR